MRSIDIHAHIAPGAAVNLTDGKDWHGFTKAEDSGRHFLVRESKRYWLHPSYLLTPEQRLEQMDSVNVDVHVLSTWTQLYNYDLPAEVAAATSRDCNDYIAQLIKTWPQRFAGLATLPMQDVPAAIAELEHSITQLGLKLSWTPPGLTGCSWAATGLTTWVSSRRWSGSTVWRASPKKRKMRLSGRTWRRC